MDLAKFEELLSERGQRALTAAAALEPSDAAFLSCLQKLRKLHPPELAKAALEMALLRIRARKKFARAHEMYFTRESLEQSSGDRTAEHRARRLSPCGSVADLCCGIGGDAAAFARAGATVCAVDCDPLRLSMARANAHVLGLGDKIQCRLGDALTEPLAEARAAFADPDRRASGRRYLDPEDYTPALSQLRSRFSNDFPLAVKIAPGVAWRDINDLPAEIEFVSVDGELKECVAWFGPLRTSVRRATLLPDGATFFGEPSDETPAIEAIQTYVYDPDPAVVRAGLAAQLARELDLAAVDPAIDLFTGKEAIESPFLTRFRIERSGRFHLVKLRDHLRAERVGRVTPIKRGSSVDAEELLRKLKLEGPERREVILTRISGEEAMLIGERV